MSLPTTDSRESACTKSISSSADTGSATSHPNSCSTWGARRRATAAPSWLETPVTSTRRGRKGGTTSSLTSGAEAGIHSGRPQALPRRSSWPVTWGARGDPEPRALTSGAEARIDSGRTLGTVAPATLWVDAANRRGVGDPLHRERVSRRTHVDVFVHRRVEDLVERPRDHVVQLGVDLLLFPEEGLQVLHPLEVGDDHTSGVGDDVRHQKDPSVVEDGIGVG